jgi:isocitrate dehydrogenase
VAQELRSKEQQILAELNGPQGKAVQTGGYYKPDPQLCSHALRPSPTLNAIVQKIGGK